MQPSACSNTRCRWGRSECQFCICWDMGVWGDWFNVRHPLITYVKEISLRNEKMKKYEGSINTKYSTWPLAYIGQYLTIGHGHNLNLLEYRATWNQATLCNVVLLYNSSRRINTNKVDVWRSGQWWVTLDVLWYINIYALLYHTCKNINNGIKRFFVVHSYILGIRY